jgi:hypothetical protein
MTKVVVVVLWRKEMLVARLMFVVDVALTYRMNARKCKLASRAKTILTIIHKLMRMISKSRKLQPVIVDDSCNFAKSKTSLPMQQASVMMVWTTHALLYFDTQTKVLTPVMHILTGYTRNYKPPSRCLDDFHSGLPISFFTQFSNPPRAMIS